MSKHDYRLMTMAELVNQLENGEMQTNAELCAELMRRIEEEGTHYSNIPEDIERWKSDIKESIRRIHSA